MLYLHTKLHSLTHIEGKCNLNIDCHENLKYHRYSGCYNVFLFCKISTLKMKLRIWHESLKYSILIFKIRLKCTRWRTKWSSNWSINKIFISVVMLETNIQKEKTIACRFILYESSVQYDPPLRLATLSTRTVMLLITRQHISSVISL
jgi:hypothetical protein